MKFLKFITCSLGAIVLIMCVPLIGMLIAHIMEGDTHTAWVIFSILIPFFLLFIVALIAAAIVVPINAKVKKSAWGLQAIAKATGKFLLVLFGLFSIIGVLGIIHNYATMVHGGSRCFAKGVDFVDLTVGHDKYHVPAHDIFMMPHCNERTSKKEFAVDWFSVGDVTPYAIVIDIGEHGPTNPSIEESKAKFLAKFYALKDSPTNSMGLILHLGTYVGFKDDGKMVLFGCNGEPARGTCKGHSSGVNEYYFPFSELRSWKQVDDAAQAYVASIRQ